MAWKTPKPLFPVSNSIITAKDLEQIDVYLFGDVDFHEQMRLRRQVLQFQIARVTPKAHEFAQKLSALCREYECTLTGDGSYALSMRFDADGGIEATLERREGDNSFTVLRVE